jgi:ABC-type polar amino acid transport system ATPase subunit
VIRIRGLRKKFDEKEVLRGIDLEVKEGQTAALIGPSGSGKTTLLRCANFLEHADEGELEIDEIKVSLKRASGRNVLQVRRMTAMVFQQYNLFRNMNALRNVSLGLTAARKQKREDAEAAARAALEKVGLGDRLESFPLELSGGQQQRVAIARAMVLNPRIIFFDEPTH